MPTDEDQTVSHVVGPAEGKSLIDGFAVLKLLSAETGGAFSLVVHTLQPGMLGAPMHTHRDVNECSFVLEGEIGVLIGDQELRAGPGTLVVKPKGIPHTFWNPGSVPARLLELIWPGGFESYFEELDRLLRASGGVPEPDQIVRLADRYGMEMDFASIPDLMQRYGVRLGG